MWKHLIHLSINLLLHLIKLTKDKSHFFWMLLSPQNSSPPPLPDLEPAAENPASNTSVDQGRPHGNSSPPPLSDLEAAGESPAPNTSVDQGRPHGTNESDSGMILIYWSFIGLCVAAIAATLQALQTYGNGNNGLLQHSMSFHWICMALVFSLTSLLLSVYLPPHFRMASSLLLSVYLPPHFRMASILVVHLSIFTSYTTLVVALVVNLLPPFKAASLAVYSIGILFIILSNLFKPRP